VQVTGLDWHQYGHRPDTSLGGHRGTRESGHQTSTSDEPLPGRFHSWWGFADHGTEVTDPAQHLSMTRRVEPIHPASHHRYRAATSSQCCTMGLTLHTVRTTGNDDVLSAGQIIGDLPGN